MAGRPKQGIDYAGWSVNIFDGDTKIDKLLDAQGWTGFSIYFYLCQMAYKFDGYFYRWSYDDSSSTARRMGGGIRSGTVSETVRFCLQIGLFHQGLFDRWGILTSRGIQRRFFAAIQSRRVKAVLADYWLLDDEESKGLELCAQKTLSPTPNGDVQDADAHLQPANAPKRKGKQSKEKERTIPPPAREGPSGHGSAVSFFLDRISPTASPYALEELAGLEQDLGTEVCIRAMLLAQEKGKANWRFIRGILHNKQRDGIRSLAAWDAQEVEFAQQHGRGKQYGTKPDHTDGTTAGAYGVQPDLSL